MKARDFFSNIAYFVNKHPLRTILILGLVHGLMYVFMVPLWWHHEEPGHFEYAWLAANRDEWPQGQDYDTNLRKEIAESMLASGQENLYNVSPERLEDDPVYLGGSPVGRKPVYYWLASLLLKPLHNQPIQTQLYAVRLASLALFLISIWLSWLFMGELVNKEHPLQWMIPFSLALLPGYVDNMTSVHDDVMGALVAALFLWLSVRWIKRGFSIFTFIGWAISIALCFYSRDTTIPLVFLAPLVPLFSVLKQKTFPVMGILSIIVIIVASINFVTFQDASQWFSYPAGDESTRLKTAQAPFGDFVFSLPSTGTTTHFGQSFSPGFIKPLRKKTFTLGVWIWTDEPTQLSLPVIQYRTPSGLANSPENDVLIGTSPTFYTTTLYIPHEASHTWLNPLLTFPDNPTKVYYDGFVLAEGQHSSALPIFTDESLLSGIWDGEPFTNLIRNPSAERTWLGASKASHVLKLRWYIEPALYLQTIQDTQGFGWYYKLSISTLFQTFWGRGAAAQIPLLGGYTYDLVQLISLISLLGVLFYVYQSPSLFTRPEMLFLFIVILTIWALTFFRGTFWIFDDIVAVPYARYAYPAFIPTLLIFSAGFRKTLKWLSAQYELPKNTPGLAFQTFMSTLSIYAIFSFGGPFYSWLQSMGYLIMLMALAMVIFTGLKNTCQIRE